MDLLKDRLSLDFAEILVKSELMPGTVSDKRMQFLKVIKMFFNLFSPANPQRPANQKTFVPRLPTLRQGDNFFG